MSDFSAFHSSFFTIVDDGGVTILAFERDRLTEEENLELLDRDFAMLVDTFHVRNVVLNLEKVEYMSSAGIGKLISFHRRLNRMEGRLALCGLGGEARNTLEQSNLLNYFTVAEDQEAARALFAG